MSQDINGNTGLDNIGENNLGNGNVGLDNIGDGNTSSGNIGDFNSGFKNSGDFNSGYGNSIDRESGIFCSKEGTIRLFNKDSGKKWGEIDHPRLNEFIISKWIPISKMTDEEKTNDPHFLVRGGYLKTYEREEAWANYWKNTTEEDRQRVLNLPNFSASIFKKITGIKVD